jgi:hypothetical protein
MISRVYKCNYCHELIRSKYLYILTKYCDNEYYSASRPSDGYVYYDAFHFNCVKRVVMLNKLRA